MNRTLSWWSHDRANPQERLEAELQPGISLVIGRSPSSDIIIIGDEISRSHTRIEVKEDAVYVVDLDSGNGSYLDGRKITHALWESPQILTIGHFSFALNSRISLPEPYRTESGRGGSLLDDAAEDDVSLAHPSRNTPSGRELGDLIRRAADGDRAAARRLIEPFVNSDERLLDFGITSTLGVLCFKTYDLMFLTDRRIGDLAITPLTGNLQVEVAYLHKVDAYVISQPAFPIHLRLLRILLYPLGVINSYSMSSIFFRGDFWSKFLAACLFILFSVLSLAVVHYVINPLIKQMFLRFRKSGIWCKLTGFPSGVLIFADRDKLGMLTHVVRLMSNVKRKLDRVAM